MLITLIITVISEKSPPTLQKKKIMCMHTPLHICISMYNIKYYAYEELLIKKNVFWVSLASTENFSFTDLKSTVYINPYIEH